MSLTDLLVPDLICDRVTDVPFDDFVRQGVKAVVFDIDNTLVSYDTPTPPRAIRDLLLSFDSLGIRVALVSNNSPDRVRIFNESLGLFAVPDAHKPLKRALRPVLEQFGLRGEELLLVGDQLLTDVLAARLHGAYAAVVQPIKKKENRFFRFKRFLEKPFVRIYYKRKKKENAK
ncbi:MAG: YqeG family HAD IIIA-type phosphatase [Clostridia bacterium]|nr:YqeG family HAD IIIA-type phosphatase [Clostridia bacterium]